MSDVSTRFSQVEARATAGDVQLSFTCLDCTELSEGFLSQERCPPVALWEVSSAGPWRRLAPHVGAPTTLFQPAILITNPSCLEELSQTMNGARQPQDGHRVQDCYRTVLARSKNATEESGKCSLIQFFCPAGARGLRQWVCNSAPACLAQFEQEVLRSLREAGLLMFTSNKFRGLLGTTLLPVTARRAMRVRSVLQRTTGCTSWLQGFKLRGLQFACRPTAFMAGLTWSVNLSTIDLMGGLSYRQQLTSGLALPAKCWGFAWTWMAQSHPAWWETQATDRMSRCKVHC